MIPHVTRAGQSGRALPRGLPHRARDVRDERPLSAPLLVKVNCLQVPEIEILYEFFQESGFFARRRERLLDLAVMSAI